jgi:hypothetical protein
LCSAAISVLSLFHPSFELVEHLAVLALCKYLCLGICGTKATTIDRPTSTRADMYKKDPNEVFILKRNKKRKKKNETTCENST